MKAVSETPPECISVRLFRSAFVVSHIAVVSQMFLSNANIAIIHYLPRSADDFYIIRVIKSY